ncbi:MAG: hypothetical protein JNL13_01750, partial [Chitinophagaceae bacterium]|nr:hypothetical protein [Chitinophagaceae bacterium]
MMNKISIGFIFLLLLQASSGFAQAKAEEKRSGYRGGFNEHIASNEKALHFLVLGDWGRNGEYYQKDVAQQMNKTAATLGTDF